MGLKKYFNITFSSLLAIYSLVSAVVIVLLVSWLLVFNALDIAERQFNESKQELIDNIEVDLDTYQIQTEEQLLAYVSGLLRHRTVASAEVAGVHLQSNESLFGEHDDLHAEVVTAINGQPVTFVFHDASELAIVNQLRDNAILFVALYCIGVVIAVSLTSYYIRTRFAHLREMASDIAKGVAPKNYRYTVTDLNSLVSTFQGMSKQLLKRERELKFSLGHDSLTGLYNRGLFESLLADQLQHDGAGQCALLMLDVEHFRHVNNNYGHECGDRLLTLIAIGLERFGSRMHVCGRMGSDQFAVLVNYESEAELDQFCRGILRYTNRVVYINGNRIAVSLRMGVVSVADGRSSNSASYLMHRADTALANAKRADIAVCYHDEVLFKQNERFLQVIRSLKEGEYNLARSGFNVHYQPKYHLADGSIKGVEALVRWRHPDLGYIEAKDIINAASQSSMLGAITLRVVDIVVDALVEWRSAGIDMTVAVNIGPAEISSPNFSNYLIRALEANNLPSSCVELEITEHAVLDDDENIRMGLECLKGAGFNILIDDFGVGYANFRNLRSYPFSSIKIDRDFVSEMLSNPRDSVIVHATLQLARDLGMSVVAEGVEDTRCAEALIEAGCDYVQGFLFSRPVPREAIVPLCINNNAGNLIKTLNSRVDDKRSYQIR